MYLKRVEEKNISTSYKVTKWLFNYFYKMLKQPPQVFYKKAVLFDLEYCEIYNRNYFEKRLGTAASENVFMKLGKIENYS